MPANRPAPLPGPRSFRPRPARTGSTLSRSLGIAIWLAALFGPAGPTAGQSYHQRIALEGHESFEVQIVGLGDNETAQKVGLDGGELLDEVERRLQSAGVKVEPLGEEGARALLDARVLLAFDAELDVAIWSAEAMVRQAILDPEGRVIFVSTWNSGGFVGTAILPRAATEIHASVVSQVDRFLEDYQQARRDRREH
jgi:hypothetical protein